jgi:hypothetical protein
MQPQDRSPGAPAPGPHHHYTFELYALDTKLVNGHILGKAVLLGCFHR